MCVACRYIEGGFLELNFHFSLQQSHWIIGRRESQEIVGTYLKMCLVGLSSTA